MKVVDVHTHMLNSAYLGATMLAVSGVFSGYWLFRNEERRASYEVGFAGAFTFWGVMWGFIGGANEIGRYFTQSVLGSALVYTSLTAAILTWLGIRKAWPLPRWIALFLPAIAWIYALAHAQLFGHPFARWGALGWPVVFATHFALLRIWEPECRASLRPPRPLGPRAGGRSRRGCRRVELRSPSRPVAPA